MKKVRELADMEEAPVGRDGCEDSRKLERLLLL
jgi:hypothetical protein